MAELSNQNNILAAIQGYPLRYELVEIKVDADSVALDTFSFPTNQNLQGKRILYIDAFNDELMSVSPLGIAVVTVAMTQKSYLTLYSTPISRENLRQIPFISLNPHFVPGGASTAPNVQQRILLNNIGTDWNKCKIKVPGGIGGAVAKSYLLGVWYIDA